MQQFGARLLFLLAGSLFAISAAPARARAEGFVFDVDNATIIPGSGEAVIDNSLPALSQTGSGPALEQQMAPILANIVSELKQEVSQKLAPPRYDFGPMLKTAANLASMSAKAAPVDYATAIRIFSLSLGGGGALGAVDKLNQLQDLQALDQRIESGDVPNIFAAPILSVLLGIHLGKFNLPAWRYFDPNRLELYVNAFRISPQRGNIATTASWYGAHAKYQLIGGRTLARYGLVKWHGLNVISGLGYFGQSLKLSANLESASQSQTFTFAQQTLQATGTFHGQARLRFAFDSFVIPFEVASSLELLHAITLFGGFAVDFNIARSTLSAEASAPIDVSVATATSTRSTLISQPTPRLNYDMARRATPVDVRGFFGVQLGYGALALFAQAAIDSTKSVAANGGLRAFW